MIVSRLQASNQPSLLDNAAKHGSGAVDVTVRHEPGESGQMVVIEVSDDGRGLNRDRILASAKKRGLPVAEPVHRQTTD